jgi:hypothetical protein
MNQRGTSADNPLKSYKNWKASNFSKLKIYPLKKLMFLGPKNGLIYSYTITTYKGCNNAYWKIW